MKITRIVFYPSVYNNKKYSFQDNKNKQKKKNSPNNDSSEFKKILNTEIEKLNPKEQEIKRSK